MLQNRLLGSIVAALVLASPAAWAATPCKMQEIGELPVSVDGPALTVEAQINALPARMIVDTGAEANVIILRGSAARLGLVLGPVNSTFKFYGAGGGDTVATTTLKSFKIADLAAKNVPAIVTGRHGLGKVDGLLGADVLTQADVEFDIPDAMIRFFKPQNCVGDQVVYWGKAYSVAPVTGLSEGQIIVPVRINDVAMRALMDTGASVSVLTTRTASAIGIKPKSNGVSATDATQGMGAAKIATYEGVFSTFAFGDEVIRNAKLRIADLFAADTETEMGSKIPKSAVDFPPMLLGADFFRAHRVYVSRAQHRVYISYMGGPVFETRERHAPTPSSGN